MFPSQYGAYASTDAKVEELYFQVNWHMAFTSLEKQAVMLRYNPLEYVLATFLPFRYTTLSQQTWIGWRSGSYWCIPHSCSLTAVNVSCFYVSNLILCSAMCTRHARFSPVATQLGHSFLFEFYINGLPCAFKNASTCPLFRNSLIGTAKAADCLCWCYL